MANQTLNANQIAGFAKGAGFAGNDLVTAVAVALAESSGNTWAIDNDADGSQDQGLWQINTVHASEFPGMVRDPGKGSIASDGKSTMFNPASNAQAAYQISGGGSNFGAWSTYTSGAYRGFLNAASAGAKAPATTPDVTGVSGGNGGQGGPAANPGLGQYLVDDHDKSVVKLPTKGDKIKPAKLSGQVGDLRIGGIFYDVSPWVTEGSVELDADQIGQISFTLQDPTGSFGKALTRFNRTTFVPVTYKGLKLEVSSLETQSGGQPFPVYSVTAQVRIAHRMSCWINPPTMPKGVSASDGSDTLGDTPGSASDVTSITDPANDSTTEVIDNQTTDLAGTLPNQAIPTNPSSGPLGVTGATITPTDYINYWVQKFGGTLTFGQETYTQSVISPTPVQQGLDPKIYGESVYSVVQTLAGNYGYWFFDADGTSCWFGAPGAGKLTVDSNGGILGRGLSFKVGWGGSWGDPALDAIGYPDCSMTDADTFQPATIVVDLPRDRGEQIRPGMTMWLKGVEGFDNDYQGQAYLVTKVAWQMDSGQTPVSVTAVTPVDPAPNDPSLLPAPYEGGTGPNGAQGTFQSNSLSSNPKQMHLAADFVTEAQKAIGTPYVWGGDQPGGFDCSGLVEWAAAQVGITFPPPGYSGPRSQQQYEFAQASGTTLPVLQAAFIRGALLFTGTEGSEHVAISMGDGKTILQAPYTGAVVSYYAFANTGALTSYFTLAAQIPGMDYADQPIIAPGNPNSTKPTAAKTTAALAGALGVQI